MGVQNVLTPVFFLLKKRIIDIRILRENELLLLGRKLDVDELSHELVKVIEKYENEKIGRSDLVVLLSAYPKNTMSQVQDVQQILREAGINKIQYLKPNDKPSPVMVF